MPKHPRNSPCPCKSGKKYKFCCEGARVLRPDGEALEFQHQRLLAQSSPLRRLPDGLDPIDRVYFDAVRLAIEMIDSGYNRLTQLMVSISNLPPRTPAPPHAHAEALADAWLIIDTVNRLRNILRSRPELLELIPVRTFVDATQQVKGIRDFVQHLEDDKRGRIRELARLGKPVWGWVSWISHIPGSTSFFLHQLMPGTLHKGVSAGIGQVWRAINSPIDHVTFDGFALPERGQGDELLPRRFDVSGTINLLADLTNELERARSPFFSDADAAGADSLIVMKLRRTNPGLSDGSNER